MKKVSYTYETGHYEEEGALTFVRIWKDENGIEHYQFFKGCKRI